MKNKNKNKKHTIMVFKSGALVEMEMTGEPLKINSLKGYNFFVHRTPTECGNFVGYTVSETSTGAELAKGYNKTIAIKNAKEKIKKHGEKSFKDALEVAKKTIQVNNHLIVK